MPIRNPARLSASGPIDAENGYPIWYRDAVGLTLELGLDPADPNTPAMGELPNPGAPVAFPGNFPDEAFYLLVDARLTVGGSPAPGRARVVLALEAAFGGAGAVAAGQQLVFARLRVRLDGGIPAAAYTFTHPYGVTDPLTADEDGRIFLTEDVGAIPLDFDAAVRDGEVAPYLRWDVGAPAGYLGDGVTPHRIIGSPLGFDFFRLEGPQVGAGTDMVETPLFTVQGKIATRSGVEVLRAVYARSGGSTSVDTFARSDPGKTLEVSGASVPATALRGTGEDYLARATASAVPGQITVVNTSDVPPTSSSAAVTDAVTVTTADYDTTARTLTVVAISSDQDGGPALTAEGFGALPAGTATFAGLDAPPATVLVTSAGGGEHLRHVLVTGAAGAPVPVVANAGPDQTVVQGQLVTLAGSSSGTPESFGWTRDSGPVVALADPAAASTTFTAPAAGSVLDFTFTVTGPGGPSSDSVTVAVAALSPPVATAIQAAATVAVGDTVSLDGSTSTGAATFAWVQVSGPPIVDLAGADTASATFTMPTGGPVVLRLSVTGPGGPPATDDVTVTPVADVVLVQRSQFRTSVQQWRIGGSATGPLPDQVTVTFTPPGGGPPDVIGTASVDAIGGWDVRTTLSTGDGRPRPGPLAVVQVTSSRGGSTTAVIVIRN